MPEKEKSQEVTPKQFGVLLLVGTVIVGGAALLMRIFGMKEK